MKNTALIYGLASSRDFSNIRYIGKTIQPLQKRLYGHLFDSRREETYKARWIQKELREGYKIKIAQIDEVWEEDWDFWEIFWIAEYYRKGYKLTNIDAGGHQTDNMVEIIALTIKGKYIERFTSIGSAARYFNLSEKKIADNVRGEHRYVKNNVFIKASEYDPNKDYSIDKSKRTDRWKPVYQYSLSGEFIKEWSGAKEVCDTLKIPRGVLGNVLNGRQLSSRGYIWSYESDGVSPIKEESYTSVQTQYNIL